MLRLIPSPTFIEEYPGFFRGDTEICYSENPSLSEEAYNLSISENTIKIEFSTESGRFYAIKTLEQIKTLCNGKIPCLSIKDSPVFSYRSFMLDSVRHFISIEEIEKIIDIASRFKFNKFHWHLSDDQGFRIELNSYPELTAKGSIRPGDSYRILPKTKENYGGYYTKAQIKNIVEYCKERFIEVIPEIDMPGHTSAILSVYPQYHCKNIPVEIKTKEGIFKDILCAGKEETYTFLYELLDEISELFPGEYFHIGGDEAPKNHWEECPDCKKKMQELNITDANDFQVYFGNIIADYLKAKGKKVIMWNDILKGKGLNEDVIQQKWLDLKNLTVPETNSGRKTIVSDFRPYYFDYPYGMFTLKDVFHFNPLGAKGLTDKGKKSIIGIESPLWTEFINTNERIEYLLFPRMFAIACSAWGNSDRSDYKDFEKTCILLCDKLKEEGISPAPKKDWNMNIARRLLQTANFFIPKK